MDVARGNRGPRDGAGGTGAERRRLPGAHSEPGSHSQPTVKPGPEVPSQTSRLQPELEPQAISLGNGRPD